MIERMFDHGVMTSAGILHADLDSFYAAVEQRDRPELAGRPLIVGGGVVLAASYEARAFGVRGGMGGREAMRRCPHAHVVAPRFGAYVEASREVFAIFEDTTPIVEGLSIDEAFLDVSGLQRLVGPPTEIAAALRARVRLEVGLPISVGVARTKYLAKVASAVSKPDGLLVVEPEQEAAFLHPLPVERLWGVGQVTAAKLHARGIRTIGQLAEHAESDLELALGSASGRHLWALANLRDPRPVTVGRRRSSIGSQSALGGSRTRTLEELDAILVGLVDRVSRRLRAGERIGRTMTLRLRFGDFERATRSATIPRSTASTAAWIDTARALLHTSYPLLRERGCTLIGVSISGLVDEVHDEQLELDLWGRERRREESAALDRALDAVRDRFGTASVARAVTVRRGPRSDAGASSRIEEPTLPDLMLASSTGAAPRSAQGRGPRSR